jgi:hypothetical protein
MTGVRKMPHLSERNSAATFIRVTPNCIYFLTHTNKIVYKIKMTRKGIQIAILSFINPKIAGPRNRAGLITARR